MGFDDRFIFHIQFYHLERYDREAVIDHDYNHTAKVSIRFCYFKVNLFFCPPLLEMILKNILGTEIIQQSCNFFDTVAQ